MLLAIYPCQAEHLRAARDDAAFAVLCFYYQEQQSLASVPHLILPSLLQSLASFPHLIPALQ
jgi:hypothetical protein